MEKFESDAPACFTTGLPHRLSAQCPVAHVFLKCSRAVTEFFTGLFIEKRSPGCAAEVLHPCQKRRIGIARCRAQQVRRRVAPFYVHNDHAQPVGPERFRKGAAIDNPAAGKIAAGGGRSLLINAAAAHAHVVAWHTRLHFMAIDGASHPAVAARRAFATTAPSRRRWQDWPGRCDGDYPATALLEFLPATAVAGVVSAWFHWCCLLVAARHVNHGSVYCNGPCRFGMQRVFDRSDMRNYGLHRRTLLEYCDRSRHA